MYTDGGYHNLEYFNSVYGTLDVTADTFQSEVEKGLYKFTGTWELSDITSDANVVEYSMFNEEEQVIYNETVPILRDGATGAKGEDGTPGANAVSYKISAPLVYKSEDVITATFYRLEEGKRTETEYYFKVFGLNGDDYELITSGHDSQASFQGTTTSYDYTKVKITIYSDSEFLEELDTEYLELINDGENAVSKFYEISSPVIIKDGDQPVFTFYLNEDGLRKSASVYYKIYKNGTLYKTSASKATSYQYDSIIHDEDEISVIKCEIYNSLNDTESLDSEEVEYIKDGDNSISMHCLNDKLQLACNEYGKLKEAFNQNVTVGIYDGTSIVVPNSISVSIDTEQLKTLLTYKIPSTLTTLNEISFSMTSGKPDGDGVELKGGNITISVVYEGITLSKVIGVNVTKDGSSAFSLQTDNDIISINVDENGKTKSVLKDTVGINILYGSKNINDYATVTYNSGSSTKSDNLTIGNWNKSTGEVAIEQGASTSAINGKLTFNVTVNYMGVSKDFKAVFPITISQDGVAAEGYSIKGNGVYTLDSAAEYSFYKTKGANSALVNCYYIAEYSDYLKSAFTEFANDGGTAVSSFSFTALASYNRVKLSIYSDSAHTDLLDTQIYYLVTESPQIIVLNNYQYIATDVDNITTSAGEITINFYGMYNKQRTAVTLITSDIAWPEGFSYKSSKNATAEQDGELVIGVAKGIEIDEYGSVTLTFKMNEQLYTRAFTYTPKSDGINNFSLLMNANQLTFDVNTEEVYPDMIIPNVIHTTSSSEGMVNKEVYNEGITEDDDKLKVRGIAYPSLDEVYVKYDKQSSYESDTQYYTRVYPKAAYGYTDGSKDINKGWTVKAIVDGEVQECAMVFFVPNV